MSGIKSKDKAARDLELAVKEARKWIQVCDTVCCCNRHVCMYIYMYIYVYVYIIHPVTS